MKKRIDFKLLSILFLIVLVFFALSTFAMTAKKEMVQEWISAKDGGSITLEGVTITFGPGILKKDTKIHIIYFGDGEYQFGPEIKINGTFTICFEVAPEKVFTFRQGEWVEVDDYDGSGCFETDHFSRYRGC
ncbi:hypothetical protein A2V47_01070 [Candidatus Atribacteria bacterium RBG_19FT_COMBO_35_14]|uniref:Uncharacterized protein n=1 Tax=Candidatus Sediminicultor quintus TaxID=1797291 RepID=A0A1F5AFV3_9BACT|nr:MAG: hypothetical protein A2V47_01070 [Candidatus Atribacteria bacterium RBG_19FT_COMBO_35_14]